MAQPFLDLEEIQAILPHREPFLFVDSVRAIDPGERIVGELRVRESLRFLHRDETPYLPPTILIEAMAQVGAILVLYPEENRGRAIYFRSIENAEFPRRASLGSLIVVEARVRKLRARFGSLVVTATIGEEIAAKGVMSFAMS